MTLYRDVSIGFFGGKRGNVLLSSAVTNIFDTLRDSDPSYYDMRHYSRDSFACENGNIRS